MKMSIALSDVERRLLVERRFRIKTYDVDFAGVVSNIVYIRWLEDLRLEIHDRYLPLKSLLERDIVPVLAETTIRYKRPLRLFDDPMGYMWITKMGRARFNLAAEFVANGVVTTEAEHVAVFVSMRTMRSIPAPPELRAQFEHWPDGPTDRLKGTGGR